MAESFKVDTQTQRDVLGPSGQLVPSIIISFTTIPHNLHGTVTVPRTQADPATVEGIITTEVARMVAIQNL